MDDGDGLENRCGRKVTGGSNPSPSAKCSWIVLARVPSAMYEQKLNTVWGGAGVDDRGRLLSGCGVYSSTQGSNPCLPAWSFC